MRAVLAACAVVVSIPAAALLGLYAWQTFVVLALNGLLP